MSLRVSGKNLDLGEVLRAQAEERLAAAVEKYFDGGFSGHVTVERDGADFKTECAVHLDSGANLNVSASAGDAYASLHHAIDRISKQLRRAKRKREQHSPAGSGLAAVIDDAAGFDLDQDDQGSSCALIAEPPTQLAVMSMAHAVAALERNGGASILFKNVGTRRFNYIYRREDGHIGWIDLSEHATPPRDKIETPRTDTQGSQRLS